MFKLTRSIIIFSLWHILNAQTLKAKDPFEDERAVFSYSLEENIGLGLIDEELKEIFENIYDETSLGKSVTRNCIESYVFQSEGQKISPEINYVLDRNFYLKGVIFKDATTACFNYVKDVNFDVKSYKITDTIGTSILECAIVSAFLGPASAAVAAAKVYRLAYQGLDFSHGDREGHDFYTDTQYFIKQYWVGCLRPVPNSPSEGQFVSTTLDYGQKQNHWAMRHRKPIKFKKTDLQNLHGEISASDMSCIIKILKNLYPIQHDRYCTVLENYILYILDLEKSGPSRKGRLSNLTQIPIPENISGLAFDNIFYLIYHGYSEVDKIIDLALISNLQSQEPNPHVTDRLIFMVLIAAENTLRFLEAIQKDDGKYPTESEVLDRQLSSFMTQMTELFYRHSIFDLVPPSLDQTDSSDQFEWVLLEPHPSTELDPVTVLPHQNLTKSRNEMRSLLPTTCPVNAKADAVKPSMGNFAGPVFKVGVLALVGAASAALIKRLAK